MVDKDGSCMDLVRKWDHDRYLTALFAPASKRPTLFALYAYNIELARCAEAVSEPLLGEIRLQWWRDAVTELRAGQPRQHYVTLALAQLLAEQDLSHDLLDAMIEARRQDLDPEGPADSQALARYLRDSSGASARLAGQICGLRGPQSDQVQSSIGLAWGLLGILRAIPYDAARKRRRLPGDLLRMEAVSLSDFYELRGSEALCRVVETLANWAESEIKAAQDGLRKLPMDGRAACLLLPLAEAYLGALRKAGHDPFTAGFGDPLPSRPWRLLMARLFGPY